VVDYVGLSGVRYPRIVMITNYYISYNSVEILLLNSYIDRTVMKYKKKIQDQKLDNFNIYGNIL